MTVKTKDEIDPKWPTIFELAAQIPEVDLRSPGRTRGGKNRPHVAKGLEPEPFPTDQPYFYASVPQILSLRVPVIEINGGIRGFQREKMSIHARQIARAMLQGKEMPPVIVSVFPDGKGYLTEGQHRAIGAIIARMPLEVVVKQRTVAQARELFANQTKARRVKSDDTLLTGDSPLELYIQDALTSDDHPWSDLVGQRATDRRISPTTMAISVGAYVYNSMNNGISFYSVRPLEQWDEKKANELSRLIRPFGTKQTNPMAFRGSSIRAIAYAALHIVRRNPEWRGDRDMERWRSHMPKFDFGKRPHLLSKENEMSIEMVAHWNKRLPKDRLVLPWTLS
jgi:hypothetical protein